jgi:hypothetical protein
LSQDSIESFPASPIVGIPEFESLIQMIAPMMPKRKEQVRSKHLSQSRTITFPNSNTESSKE